MRTNLRMSHSLRTMSRIYHHYTKWEDFHAWLYESNDCNDDLKNKCVEMLKNLDELEIYMKRCVDEWKYAAEQQMSNPSRNKQAWLWQAACCMKYGVNEDNVKEIWRRLSKEEMELANWIADKIISYYNSEYANEKVSWNKRIRCV
jgi:hypothetical protein